MSKAFDREEVLSRSESVKEAWMELADDWLANSDGSIQLDGFRGWNDRSPKSILLDFHLNGLLKEPLSDEEVDHLMTEILEEDRE